MGRPLYHYGYVDAPFDDVTQLLAEDAAGILQAATTAAAEHADEVVGRVAVKIGAFEVSRDVTIEVGEFEPERMLEGRVPLAWSATRHSALFPNVRAYLEVSALSVQPPVTQVTLVGEYEPPLGVLGEAGDALVGHRVAEAAIHRFLEGVLARLQAEVEARREAGEYADVE